jgi:DUF4097 and DUF4098 domain-containing protein YvlB
MWEMQKRRNMKMWKMRRTGLAVQYDQPKRRERTMHKPSLLSLSLCSLAAACLALCLWGAIVTPVSSGTEVEKTYDFAVSPGQTIKLDLKSGGSVNIVGWDDQKAEVSYAQGGKGNVHDVEVVQRGNDIVVTSKAEVRQGQSRNLNFAIRVPNSFNVNFESTGGSLTISGLDGDFEGTTMGGGLTLSDVKGVVRLKTMGGSIQVTDATLDGSLNTLGGTVYLSGVVGDVEAQSMGGNVKYENVRGRDGKLRAPGTFSGAVPNAEIGEKTVTITTMGGDITLGDAPAGAAVSTMGGDIDIENASAFVKARTMGGNIDLEVTNGWVDATTMGGNIDVDIEKGLGEGTEGVKLTSMAGDVDLALPADLSMDFDLTIKYTKNSSQDFEIKSDFPLKIERSEDWDYANGTPRKSIHATGVVGGGKYPIVIETINGDIRVMKAK